MTLNECYKALGGDYDDAVLRLTSDRLVKKYVLKFVDDPSYELLERSLDERDCAEAFRAAHTIKGICQNLSFTRLNTSAAALTEKLRGLSEYHDGLMPYFEKLREDYLVTIEAIKQLDE